MFEMMHLGSGESVPRVVQTSCGCEFKVRSDEELAQLECANCNAILRELRCGEVLFDVGARVGGLSIRAAKSGAQVYAFEPDPILRARLRENLRLNALAAVNVIAWSPTEKSGFEPRSSPALGERIVVITDTIDAGIERKELVIPQVINVELSDPDRCLSGMQRMLGGSQAPRAIFISSPTDHAARLLAAAGFMSDTQAFRRAA
jgi:ribosomal protein L11 methylase PrmA